MTNEEINDAMAEACGFTADFASDLNAMHKAEATLSPRRPTSGGEYPGESKLWGAYFHQLLRVCERRNVSSGHIPAQLRAEAFLTRFWMDKIDQSLPDEEKKQEMQKINERFRE